jgi:hypothetical protein
VRRSAIQGRPYRAVSFPSAEVVTVPAHCRVRDVQAWLAVSPRWAYVMAAAFPLVNVLLRTPLGWLTELSFRHLMPPPPEAPSGEFRFVIQLELQAVARRRTVTLRGLDPYALTAAIAVYAAGALHADGYAQAGVLAPSQALDAQAFLDWLTAAQGVSVAVSE